MKKIKHSLLLLISLSVLVTSCCNKESSYWEQRSSWFQPADSIDTDKVDLIYFVSTNIVSEKDANGRALYQALMTLDEKEIIDNELHFVDDNICKGDFNFVAPYYHQFTFDAISLKEEEFKDVYKSVTDDVCAAFDYYMEHINNGRSFVLVGFSQGGMLVLDVLKHMDNKQFEQLVAAYAIGYRISAEDLKHKNIHPATNETDNGVTISFNSVLTANGIWPFVAANAITCINPVNWTTDTIPASFTYHGNEHSVRIDKESNQLIVNTDQEDYYHTWNQNPVFQSANVSKDCLHHWDLLFYTEHIHDNIIKRAQMKDFH